MIIKWFAELPSTQKHLLTNLANYTPSYPVIATTKQTAGIGRAGSHWYCTDNALAFSYVHAMPCPYIDVLGRVKDALLRFGVKSVIKWPNDILVGQRKVCGVLVDVCDKVCVVGVGINLGRTDALDSDVSYAGHTSSHAMHRQGSHSQDGHRPDKHSQYSHSQDEHIYAMHNQHSDAMHMSSHTAYATVAMLTGVCISPSTFISTYFDVPWHSHCYDMNDTVWYMGMRMRVVNKRVLEVEDDDGVRHVIDGMRYGYDHENGCIVEKR